MLAVATRGGEWPRSRTETFELACRGLATERNAEHLSVQPTRDIDRIVDAAGRICATVLLSGSRGCATTPTGVSEDYPDVTKCGVAADDWRQAVASGLFQHPAQGRAEPVHRHIAEYIAARYIAGLIEDGLPSGRALALMTAPDGTVTSELRGLSAWLAAHSDLARHGLIERDPIGLALYGDIHAFSEDEKRTLFDSLVREPRRLEPMLEAARAMAPLATPSMHGVFEQVLSAPVTDSDDQQLVVDFTLCLLREASPPAALSPLFLDIVRDERRWPRVRDVALDALIHCVEQGEGDTDLIALLGDIHEQRLGDPDNQLLGQILSTLYPRLIPPDVVWDYFTGNTDTKAVIGAHVMFWLDDLASRSSNEQVAELLDQCHARVNALAEVSNLTLEQCVALLLMRALETQGDATDTPRLYDWLDTALRLGIGQHGSADQFQAVGVWIGERTDRHIDLMLEGLQRASEESLYAPYEVFERLFGAKVDPRFYDACARAAGSMGSSNPAVARSLLRFAVQAGHVSPDRAREAVGDDATLLGFLERLLEPDSPAPDLVRLEEARQARRQEILKEAQWRLRYLKAHQDALRKNHAPPSVLHHLACTYFGSFLGFTPEAGLKRLEELVQPDTDLLDAAVEGLRGVIARDDTPSAQTIRTLCRESRTHYLCRPYLAGLAHAESTGSLDPAWWTDDRVRTALASYFGYAHADYEPDWYRYLIEEHSARVADVQIQFAGDMLRDGVDPVNANVSRLAFDQRHAKLAGLASIPLLRSFPPRAHKRLLTTLEHLLLAALQHADRTVFGQLIDEKLSRTSLPPSHRARWLAVAAAVAPARYERAASDFVSAGRREVRTLHFASFYSTLERTAFPTEPTDPASLPAMLVRLVGQIVGPDDHSEGFVTPAMHAARLVKSCIRVLASSAGPAATKALTEFRATPTLSRWHRFLAIAADDQQVIRRDSEYRHPTVEQVGATLDNDTPTGPADLAALVLDRLDCIAARIRSTNTDDWKQLWNEDRFGRPTTPKPEESCTRALLSDLRQLLPKGVSAEPEARHSNGTRADLNLSYEDAHVPVEVKRNDNPELWRALRDQLIGKYTRDLGTGGHGVYVVLWFGGDRTQRSPVGKRPATPDELRDQLDNTLADGEQLRIAIRVINVTGSKVHAAPADSRPRT